jgi:hypothetical protein
MGQQITRIAPVAFSQGLYTQTRHQAQPALEFRVVQGHRFFIATTGNRGTMSGIYTGVSVHSG